MTILKSKDDELVPMTSEELLEEVKRKREVELLQDFREYLACIGVENADNILRE